MLSARHSGVVVPGTGGSGGTQGTLGSGIRDPVRDGDEDGETDQRRQEREAVSVAGAVRELDALVGSVQGMRDVAELVDPRVVEDRVREAAVIPVAVEYR
ncbi:hypothetical protein GCM10010289_22590 [Streptomyces violascens]|nr:hypothetical protein GCM10010289_22590 [Streptomyces violascens]